jgi:hypothetical protein
MLNCAMALPLKLLAILTLLFSAYGALINRLRFFEYCTYYNYPVEEHIIPTDDNVNLKFYRVQGILGVT